MQLEQRLQAPRRPRGLLQPLVRLHVSLDHRLDARSCGPAGPPVPTLQKPRHAFIPRSCRIDCLSAAATHVSLMQVALAMSQHPPVNSCCPSFTSSSSSTHTHTHHTHRRSHSPPSLRGRAPRRLLGSIYSLVFILYTCFSSQNEWVGICSQTSAPLQLHLFLSLSLSIRYTAII